MNRVVLLGGASRGIGAATARLLAGRGDTVVVLDAFAGAVTACGIAPGSTDTTMLRKTAETHGLSEVDDLVQQQHGRRALRPEEVATVVIFALDAGPSVHGSILPTDAGFGHV